MPPFTFIILLTRNKKTLYDVISNSQIWIYLESRRLPVLTSRPIKEAASGWIVLVDGKMNWLKDIVR
jgi:hypothetical protein